MLEIARAWREAPYQPRKTIIFVACAGGEQHESLSVFEVMNAKTGFATAFEVEAVLELSGVGAGAGERLLIAEGSSYRLTELLQAAARRVGARTTIRGNYPHSRMYQLPPRGGRSALTAVVSWEGSDALAHTALDTVQLLDPAKVEDAGAPSSWRRWSWGVKWSIKVDVWTVMASSPAWGSALVRGPGPIRM
jgi:microcompartment protein CcmK/EutM